MNDLSDLTGHKSPTACCQISAPFEKDINNFMSRLSNTFAEEIKKKQVNCLFFFLFFWFSSIFSAHTYTNTHTQFSHTFVCVCFNVAVLTSFFGALWPRSVDAPWGVFLFHLMVLPHTHVVQLLQAALQLLLQKKHFLFKYTCSKIYSFIFVIDFFVCFFFCKHWVIQSFFLSSVLERPSCSFLPVFKSMTTVCAWSWDL